MPHVPTDADAIGLVGHGGVKSMYMQRGIVRYVVFGQASMGLGMKKGKVIAIGRKSVHVDT